MDNRYLSIYIYIIHIYLSIYIYIHRYYYIICINRIIPYAASAVSTSILQKHVNHVIFSYLVCTHRIMAEYSISKLYYNIL